MEAEVWTLRGRGRPLALLWLLLLLPLAALGLRGSPSAATPASASGDTVEGDVPTPTVQRLAPGSLAPLPPPFRLQEGKVSLVENKLCNMLYEQRLSKDKNYSVYEEMLCAGNFLTGKAICQGDSGSPLVCDLFNTWVLVGLASWGVDCRHPIYPSVFTNVTYFTDWISKIQRLTPPPEPTDVPPQTPFPNGLLRAVGSPGPHAALMPPRTWLPLLSVLRAWQQALQ
uniref:Peptidase S1 domain-containing protein n=1 Tax=Molossus molossus TaxID=27622 RepID=A0A7J8EEV4_MOLMO|nr:hypothetical protein HJG59_008946 [Molossus molossus]